MILLKKVMIIMSERTGTGHKSAANAIEKKLIEKGFEVKQVDGFALMGKKGIAMENSYIPMTLKTPHLYGLGYSIEQMFPGIVHWFIYNCVKKGLKKELNDYKPDLIINVHSMFTKAISKVMRNEKLNNPYYACVVDLVDPPSVWFNKECTKTFVPTNDIKEAYIKKGMDPNRIIYYGFPTRDDIVKSSNKKQINGLINILLVNPSVNLKKNVAFAKEVSRIENSKVTFICGRDEKLFSTLSSLKEMGKLDSKIEIHSFVSNMNEYLNESHILLTKAGPNMMLEAINSNTLVIVTGHIIGQENTNYKYITNNKLGIKCENPNKIYDELNECIKSGRANEYLDNVYNFTVPKGADVVSKHTKIDVS